jgi:hypothetical protein
MRVCRSGCCGSFLTLFGLYLGIAQVRRGNNGRLSPYRGTYYWHHITGLVFGECQKLAIRCQRPKAKTFWLSKMMPAQTPLHT